MQRALQEEHGLIRLRIVRLGRMLKKGINIVGKESHTSVSTQDTVIGVRCLKEPQ